MNATHSAIAGTFACELANLLADEIRRQRREGTVGMSEGNLWSVTACRIAHLNGAPRGTNAAYFAHETFREVCDHLPSNLRDFIV